jgi:hypothetical protein
MYANFIDYYRNKKTEINNKITEVFTVYEIESDGGEYDENGKLKPEKYKYTKIHVKRKKAQISRKSQNEKTDSKPGSTGSSRGSYRGSYRATRRVIVERHTSVKS